MIKIMEIPKVVTVSPGRFTISHYSSRQIRKKFWDDSHSWSKPNIPNELIEKNWEPESGKTYKCWWYYTNPSDPADPGEYILVYVEELESDEKDVLKKEYISKINDYMSKLSLNGLENLYEKIENLI